MKRKVPVTCRKKTNDTQKTINRYHTLLKLLNNATGSKKQEIETEISEMGGLVVYQQASLKGAQTGNGAGIWLVKQLDFYGLKQSKMKILDVGSISGEVYIKYSFMDVTCIDLNSQSPLVKKLDFFDLKDQKYDIVCLSLVINFISDPVRRGQMIIKTREHLNPGGLLYIVLPLACTENSRYLTHARFVEICQSLGYEMIVYKNSKKLCFYLFKLIQIKTPTLFKKTEINGGKKRNNFSITILGTV